MLETDKAAQTDVDIFLEAARRFQIASDATNEDRANAVKDLEFLNGSQWDDDIKNQRRIDGRPALTINHTKTNILRIENMLKQQRPRIKAHPTGGGARIEDAHVVNGLIRHIENISHSSVAYDIGGGAAIKVGWGYWRIVGEYLDDTSFDQELKIKPIDNAFTVYDDPSAVMPSGEDREWLLITDTMKHIDYKLKYPDADNSDFNGDSPGDYQREWEGKENIRLAEYYRIVSKKDTLYRLQDGSGMTKTEYDAHEELMPGAIQLAMDSQGKPISRPTFRRQVEWYKLNGTKIVESRSLPGKYIPVIRCQGNVENVNGKITRYGMVKDLKDPARMYNYWRTAETERYALAPKAPWVMAEGQADGHPEWDSANQKSYSRLEYKPVTGPNGEMLPPPMRQNPVQVEAGITQAAAGAEHDLSAIAGYMPENPQERSAIVSGNKYLQRRQGMADLVHWHYYDNQSYSIMFTGIILLDLIPWYYDTPRMQRIIGEDGIPSMTQINDKQEVSPGVFEIKNNLTVGKYDVVMDTGPGYQTKREESSESLLELLKTPLAEPILKVGPDIVVRNMDFPDADVLADRLAAMNPESMDETIKNLPKQAQTIVSSLMQQLKQAKDTIQQQGMEIKYKTNIEQMKDAGQTKRTLMTTTAKAHDIEMRDESKKMDIETSYRGKMEEVHINANVRKDVAEIAAAASLLNTRAEAEADEKAAKRMIAAGIQDSPN